MAAREEKYKNPHVRKEVSLLCQNTISEVEELVSHAESCNHSKMYKEVLPQLFYLLTRVSNYEFDFSTQGGITPEEILTFNSAREKIATALSLIFQFLGVSLIGPKVYDCKLPRYQASSTSE